MSQRVWSSPETTGGPDVEAVDGVNCMNLSIAAERKGVDDAKLSGGGMYSVMSNRKELQTSLSSALLSSGKLLKLSGTTTAGPDVEAMGWVGFNCIPICASEG